MFIQTTGISDVRPQGKFIAHGLGKLEQASTGKFKDRLYNARPLGQNQYFADLRVAAVELDQGAPVRGDIVGTEPLKTLAKHSLKKSAHCLRVHRGKLDTVDHLMP